MFRRERERVRETNFYLDIHPKWCINTKVHSKDTKEKGGENLIKRGKEKKCIMDFPMLSSQGKKDPTCRKS